MDLDLATIFGYLRVSARAEYSAGGEYSAGAENSAGAEYSAAAEYSAIFGNIGEYSGIFGNIRQDGGRWERRKPWFPDLIMYCFIDLTHY